MRAISGKIKSTMCGIFGYANYHKRVKVREILEILLNGLKKVEYRGYDSAGLAIEASSPAEPPVVIRSTGNIQRLRERVFGTGAATDGEAIPPLDMEAERTEHVGIAHTRWATHGEVSIRNCHPQQSNHGEFTIVHNGIMTNYIAVKQLLQKEGYAFTSETDTEVICVLAQHLYTQQQEKDFVRLAQEVTHFVEGAYALLITSMHFPGQLVACRKGSPLMVGVRCLEAGGRQLRYRSLDASAPPFGGHGSTEFFFASDSNSFVEHTADVVYLEDNDIVLYKAGQIHFYRTSVGDAGGSEASVSREVRVLETALESLSKGAYEHFMLKEIYEQAQSVLVSMQGRIDFANHHVHLGGFTQTNIDNVMNSRRLLLISCGTSMNSCLAVRPLWEELLPLPVTVENASDFLDRSPAVHRDDTCIFVSQSGETADTLMAMAHCRNSGALCVGVTNVVGSSISRMTDFGAHLNAGVEVGVASTKAYTSQCVVLTLIALLLCEDSRRVRARREEVIDGLATLSATINATLSTVAGPIERLAERLKDCQSILVLGRGYDYATALEAALKIKELSYVHTEGINSGELKHGPLALVDEHMPVIALCSMDRHYNKCKAAIQQVNARKGKVVVVTTHRDDELATAADEIIEVPQIVEGLQCIVNVIPFQLLAYHMALKRGNDVDCPRNLAKSVTTQ